MYVSWDLGLSRTQSCGMHVYDADGHVSWPLRTLIRRVTV